MTKIYAAYEGLPNLPRGEDHPKAKINEKKVFQIRKFHAKGWTIKRIAAKYGVSTTAISRVLSGKSWKHI
jgi:hypothetical protein